MHRENRLSRKNISHEDMLTVDRKKAQGGFIAVPVSIFFLCINVCDASSPLYLFRFKQLYNLNLCFIIRYVSIKVCACFSMFML